MEKFTLEHESFSDNGWLYFLEKLSDDDRSYVDELCLFYDGIQNYANKNHIYPTQFPSGEFFKIKLSDIGFEIGMIWGQGTSFFCNRVPVEKDFIDFNDIIDNKKNSQNEIIKTKLEQLSSNIISLYQNGIPFEAITNTIKNTMTEINSQINSKNDKESNPILRKKI